MRKGIYAAMALLVGACFIGVGCDDDDTETATGSGSTSTGTTNTGSGGSTGTGGGAAPTCTDLCTVLHGCAEGEDTLCPDFDATLQEFLDGPNGDDGCISGCEANPALAVLIDGDNCTNTVTQIIAVNPDFACSCDDSLCGAGGGGGAGGAAGGAGGAGGS